MSRPRTTYHQIEKLLIEGKKPREIQKSVQTTGSSICYVRRKLGIPPFKAGRPRGFKNTETRERVMEMKARGLSYSQIGKHFGFSHQRAQQYVLVQRRGPERKVEKCSDCGKLGVGLSRHHEDYTKEDTVMLCLSCHGKRTVEQHKKQTKNT